MKKFLLFLLISLLFALPVRAICPVCTVAVGAGVGLSRYLGIDDLISGIWIGGLIISLALWVMDWLDKRKIHFPFRKVLVLCFFYFLTLFPLYSVGMIGSSCNQFLGIDRLLFGIILGSSAFLMGFLFHNFLKSKNEGKVFFPFQKVFLPVLFLLITSLILFLIR